jgi:hypothetical protein
VKQRLPHPSTNEENKKGARNIQKRVMRIAAVERRAAGRHPLAMFAARRSTSSSSTLVSTLLSDTRFGRGRKKVASVNGRYVLVESAEHHRCRVAQVRHERPR